jgi:hypothetical protein
MHKATQFLHLQKTLTLQPKLIYNLTNSTTYILQKLYTRTQNTKRPSVTAVALMRGLGISIQRQSVCFP